MQHSWFPGYAWALLYCEICEEHLGWHFTRAPSVVPTSASTGGVEDDNGGGGDQHAGASSQSQLVGAAGDRSASAGVDGDGVGGRAGGDGGNSDHDDHDKSPRAFFGLRRTALVETMSGVQ